MSDDVLVCLSTCPNADTARSLAEALVSAGLAACVNQLPGIVSTYAWKGQLHTDQEVLLVIKTTAGRLGALRERLVALHPYEVPELVALPAVDGHAPYLDWVRAHAAGDGSLPGGAAAP
ncbi:MAG: divalent-cation tolerance protein CutA [Pseudomonadota bacterium]